MKSLKKIYRILLVGAVLLSISCNKDRNCLDGNGRLTTEERIVSKFYGVINETSFDVEIFADSVSIVEVTADENLLSIIETTVRNGNLYVDIDDGRCIKSNSHVIVEIHMPYLDLVELTGSGNMEAFDFDSDNFEVNNSGSGDVEIMNLYCDNTVDINVSGSGDIEITGKTYKADYRLSGSGDIFGEDLRADECDVVSSGSGDIHCWAYDLLNVNMSGSGDVFYYGSPEMVRQNINGSGDLRSRSK